MEEIRKLNRRYIAAASAADGAYYRWAKHSGVTMHTLDLLYALDDGAPHSQKQICEEWMIPKTSINTVVTACREAGHVILEPMPDQPRQRQICLTEAGRRYARETLRDLYAAEDRAMSETVDRFGPEFLDAIEFWCARFRAHLDENLSEKEETSSI